MNQGATKSVPTTSNVVDVASERSHRQVGDTRNTEEENTDSGLEEQAHHRLHERYNGTAEGG